MKTYLTLIIGTFVCCVSLCSNLTATPAISPLRCPIGLERLDLRYNHVGGESVPQLKLAFTNRSEKTITSMLFSLSILDSAGNPHPYIENLSYRRDIPPGDQQRSHTWNLDRASIDMHHSGESVTLLETQFADGTEWKDDGSQSCTLLVDFHPK
jgi:hypothetical protein